MENYYFINIILRRVQAVHVACVYNTYVDTIKLICIFVYARMCVYCTCIDMRFG